MADEITDMENAINSTSGPPNNVNSNNVIVVQSAITKDETCRICDGQFNPETDKESDGVVLLHCGKCVEDLKKSVSTPAG